MVSGHVFRIQIKGQCRKHIERSPVYVKRAIDGAFQQLRHNPYHGVNIKELTGKWKGYYRYRIGEYRLVYRIDEECVTVIAVAFGSRGDVYK